MWTFLQRYADHDLQFPFLFISCLTNQAIQYLLAPVVRLFSCLFVGVFFCLFSFHLGLFFVCLGPKFNLSRDDCIFLSNLSCHMAPVCNFPVRGTVSFNKSYNFFTPEIQKYLNICLAFVFSFLFLKTLISAPFHHNACSLLSSSRLSGGRVVIFSFGQEVGCKKILYDVGWGGGTLKNFAPFKKYPLPPSLQYK